MTSNSNGDKELAHAGRAFKARQEVRDLDAGSYVLGRYGDTAAAGALADQAKAALQAEEALRRHIKPPKHRK